MSERWIELPVVVAGRKALDQALRQWKHYADEHRSLDHGRALGETGMLEDRMYESCKAAAEGLEAAADESAKASLAPKTAFAPAHGSESARRLVLAYCQGRREVIEATIATERLAGNAVKEQAERTALVEVEGIEQWVVRGGLTQNAKLCERGEGA